MWIFMPDNHRNLNPELAPSVSQTFNTMTDCIFAFTNIQGPWVSHANTTVNNVTVNNLTF